MKHCVSRREFLAVTGALAVAGVLPTQAQEPSAQEVEVIISQLSADLSDEHKRLLAEAVNSNAEAARARRRYALPENSEPCFVFRPTRADGRR